MKDTLLYPPKKRIGKYPHTSRFETVKIDLNQFINLTRRKDMRKISLKELFYLKSL